ncbi:hypothetical protein HDZ31DRAFT_67027 [Schizophyllum fasciatum]
MFGKQADDYALKGFLDFLVRARRILLQDAAILFVEHPECDFFNYAPFDNSTFHAFASRSGRIILDIEQRFRKNMKNLPMHIAATFRGVVGTVGIEQQSMMNRIDARFHAMESLMEQFIQTSAGSTRKRKRGQQLKTPATVSVAPAHPSILGDGFTAIECAPVSFHHSPSPPHLGASSTAPAASSDSAQAVFLDPPHPPTIPSIYNPGVTFREKTPVVDVERIRQETAMKQLLLKYGEERVRRHEWDWIESAPPRFLPRYLYARRKRSENGKDEPLSVDDIWNEHVIGLDGHFSIAQLNDGWGGSWKRNVASEKSEGSRRAKLVALVQDLQKRPNWTSILALQFLRTQYSIMRQSPFPHLRSTRAFMEWLQRTKDGDNYASVLESASFYHGIRQ